MNPAMFVYMCTTAMALEAAVVAVLLFRLDRARGARDVYIAVIIAGTGTAGATILLWINPPWVAPTVSLWWPCLWFGVAAAVTERWKRLFFARHP